MGEKVEVEAAARAILCLVRGKRSADEIKTKVLKEFRKRDILEALLSCREVNLATLVEEGEEEGTRRTRVCRQEGTSRARGIEQGPSSSLPLLKEGNMQAMQD
jgi:hypothetical protein